MASWLSGSSVSLVRRRSWVRSPLKPLVFVLNDLVNSLLSLFCLFVLKKTLNSSFLLFIKVPCWHGVLPIQHPRHLELVEKLILSLKRQLDLPVLK